MISTIIVLWVRTMARIKYFFNEDLPHRKVLFSFVYDNNYKWTIVRCKRTNSYLVQHRIRYYNENRFYEDIGNNFMFETFQAAQEKFEQLKGELQCQY